MSQLGNCHWGRASMPEMYFALYRSDALVPDTPEVHNDILTVSKRNNEAANVTGFLHREGNHFVQYLEGPKTQVFDTLFRIGRDTRHENFEILRSGPAPKRMLPDWQMGFTHPSQLSLRDLLCASEDDLDLHAMDPFDLVVFLVHNATALRKE